MTADGAKSDRFDVVFAEGTVMDPGARMHDVADVGIANGVVREIGPRLASRAREVVDCSGKFVTPGLVDCHTHIFADVSAVGAPPDEAHLRRGVVAACDAGTSGASTFAAFRRYIAEAAEMRITCFLNVSVLGLIDFRFGELLLPQTLCADDALRTAADHPDIVKGLKIRLSEDVVGGPCLPLLSESVEVAQASGLPLMVHIGETIEPLPPILDLLRAGDIVSHCYSGKPHTILGDRGVLREVHEARERGVLFDSAHGKSNLAFSTARRAIDEGFVPDLVSSDTSRRNWYGPVYDLVTTMSKLLALGIDFDALVERTTIRPAELLGLRDEGYGTIEIGSLASLTVLELVEDEFVLTDGVGDTLTAPRIEPVAAMANGRQVQLDPWRGAARSLSTTLDEHSPD